MNRNARIIAFYLPQFFPTKENDEWWGKGFTEWTNVGRAKPLFRGHYQPHVPADLSYYDLRVPEVRVQQAAMARAAGVEGFCYWHYWFGNGKRLLERVFNEVLASGQPDFPFCLGWANHSWYAKLWDKNGKGDKLLIGQEYLGKEDYKMHFDFALKAFRDKRYIMDGDKPVFMIFKPMDVPSEFYEMWQEWAVQNGFKNGIAFIGQCRRGESTPEQILRIGCDYVLHDRFDDFYANYSTFMKVKQHLKSILLNKPLLCFDYNDFYPYLTNKQEDALLNHIPMIVPRWDHSPRSGRKGLILTNDTPQNFEKHVRRVLEAIKEKPINKRFVFLKSWNEWGEGNYMEPDLKYGDGFLRVLNNYIFGDLHK